MHRFFVPPDAIQHQRASLRGPIVHQIRDVLRMRPGDQVWLLDNTGSAFRTELTILERDMVRGRILEQTKPETEAKTRITLYQGVLKGQKFDWVLQKGTEIGISSFVPMLSARCVMGSLEDVGAARIDRWTRIITEAAEQSGRVRLPVLEGTLFFDDACSAAQGGLALIPWENERATSLREVLLQALPSPFVDRPIHLFIGPEGGFTEEEIATAERAGLVPVSLGPRILRAETAGLVAAAAILYQMGDMG